MSEQKILYIPGLLPKPEYVVHREQLLRCLRHGLRHHDADVATQIDAQPDAFDVVSWTHGFYREHRDIALDLPSIDACLEKTEADAEDIREVRRWPVRLQRLIRRSGDYLPWLIPFLAGEKVARHIQDLQRYTQDRDAVARDIRDQLRHALKTACKDGSRVLLIAHSMGSVIAIDTLWEMSYRQQDELRLDTLFTMGSPLGQWFVRRRLLGFRQRDWPKCPDNIDHWHNLSAWGDMTCARMRLSGAFDGMSLQSRSETATYNWFRLDGELNPHAEYGYLANRATAETVARWWRMRA